MPTLLDELNQLISSFEEAEIEYAVCGGLSLAIHGFARATLDIDLLIQPDSLDAALEVGEKNGFDIKGLDLSFKEGTVEIRRVSKVDSEGEILSLDLLLVSPHFQDVWESRVTVEFLDRELRVVSRAGLIKMKELSGRPQDLVDIEKLTNDES